MKRYLRELYKKSDHHKKRFAFLASSTITLFIFGIWSLAVFGTNEVKIVVNEETSNTSTVVDKEIGPFQSLGMNLASSFRAVQNSFVELKNGLGAVDIEAEYEELRNRSLDIYGQ